jgi:hypothetical protein
LETIAPGTTWMMRVAAAISFVMRAGMIAALVAMILDR